MRSASWITSYTLSYSNDSLLWFTYRDGNHLDAKVRRTIILGLLYGRVLSIRIEGLELLRSKQRWEIQLGLQSFQVGTTRSLLRSFFFFVVF